MKSFLRSVLFLAALGVATPVQAQYENLQVLDPDISRAQLTGIMRGFALGLGVRCSTCHIGEEGQPLSTYDFVSDDKVMKLKAREMLAMTLRINEEVLTALPDRSQGEPTVTCATCHGGARVPRAIEAVFEARRQASGVESAIEHYAELREMYFGGRQYDFSQNHLLGMASNYLRAEDLEPARALYGATLRYFENSIGGHFGLAQIGEMEGDLDAARLHYGHVLEIDPENAVALQRLEAIGGG